MLLTLVAWAALGERVAVGAFAGSAAALGYWMLTRWLGKKSLASDGKQRMGFSFLLATKMVGLIALCWILVARVHVHPLGFAMGWSALVVGAIVGATLSSERRDASDDGDATVTTTGEGLSHG